MNSLLCNWFDDWGYQIIDGLGQMGLIIFIVIFLLLICYFSYTILFKQIPKAKYKIKWVQIIFLVIVILFTIWFCILLNKI